MGQDRGGNNKEELRYLQIFSIVNCCKEVEVTVSELVEWPPLDVPFSRLLPVAGES